MSNADVSCKQKPPVQLVVFVLFGSAGQTVQKSFRQLLFACYVKRIDDKIIKRYEI